MELEKRAGRDKIPGSLCEILRKRRAQALQDGQETSVVATESGTVV